MTRSNPGWRHRRLIIYTVVVVSLLMLTIGALDWTDRAVSSQLVIGSVTLLSIIVTAYTGFATLDDHWQRTDNDPATAHVNPQDSGTDGDGVDC